MKHLSLATITPTRLFWAMSLCLLTACGGGDGDGAVTVKAHALTEHDFTALPSVRLPLGMVGVTFLEPKDALTSAARDTGSTGTDVIPIHIAETTTITYGLDATDPTIEKARLISLPSRAVVFEINAAKPSETVSLEPGNYDLLLYSGYTIAQAQGAPHRSVFLHSGTAIKSIAASPLTVLKAANGTVSQLLSTRRCEGCDLSGANLREANLWEANLQGANLQDASLFGAYLEGAILLGADLQGATLAGANLQRANLQNANLSNAYLQSANLQNANLRSANLQNANLQITLLQGANFQFADLTGAKLGAAMIRGADFSNAIGADLTGTFPY